VLDGGAVVEAGQVEWVVLEDGGQVFDTVLKTHDFVVHGTSAAAFSVLVGVVHALVRDGGFATVFLVDEDQFLSPPWGGGTTFRILLIWL
jgi:hypothetical protein